MLYVAHKELRTIMLLDGEGDGTPLQYSCLENPMDRGAWKAAVHGVSKSRIRLSDFTFTFHFQALEKEMATHSSVLAWRIPGTGEPGGLPSMGSHRVGHNWSDLAAAAEGTNFGLLFFPLSYPVVPTPFTGGKGCSFPPWIFSVTVVKNQVFGKKKCLCSDGSVSRVSVLIHWFMCLPLPSRPHCIN